MTFADSGVFSTTMRDEVVSPYFFFYYFGDIARLRWGAGGVHPFVSRPSKTRIYYAGRRYPVS